MKLTAEQEQAIEKLVDSQGLSIRTLRDDVVDHLCCVVESELGKGTSFEQLLENATADLAPNGLKDIQDKTLFLLNAKRILLMKKIMYGIGFLGSLSLTAGITFKLLRFPFATELSTAGFLILFLVFIPLFAFDRYKVSLAKALSVRLRLIAGAVSGSLVGLSGLFKLLHLQGAEALLMLGAGVFAFGFLPFSFFTLYKKSVS